MNVERHFGVCKIEICLSFLTFKFIIIHITSQLINFSLEISKSTQTFKTLHESHIKLHPCDQKTINMCVTDLSRNLNPPPLLIPLPPPLPPPPPPPPPPPLLDVGRACSTVILS